MTSRNWVSLGVVICLASVASTLYGQQDDSETAKIRIGTYDSRAIAIAYAPSRFNPVAEKMTQYKAAQAAGDEEKVKELERWGQQHQRQLHFQGFGRVPVTDLLEHVADKLAALAREHHLAAITASCDFTGERVEVVDITDELVRLYEPTEKTLGHIREIRKKTPVSLPELAKLPADR